MTKFIFLFISFFYINSVYAGAEKVTLIFTGGLTEIAVKDKGGYAELASLLEIHRKKPTAVFFIFGGNSLFPSILSSFDHGTHIIDLLNSLEPDVMGASNGDFAFSEDELSLRTYEAAFPIVQSNIIETASGQNLDGVLNSVILQQGRYKLGFISLMDEGVLETYNLTRISVKDPQLIVAAEAEKLRSLGADLIIIHYRGTELNCIDFLKNGMVDLVLRNNNDSSLLTAEKAQKHAKQIFLAETAQAAVIELSWQSKLPQTLTVQWQAEKLALYPKNSAVQQQIKNYSSRLDLLLDEIIGVTRTDIDTSTVGLRTKENALGNLVTDLMKKHSGADIALLNGGAVRGDSFYPKNSQISRRDIVKMLPYRDTVVLLEVTGMQLLAVLENGFSQIENIKGRFPQISGMKVVYDSQAAAGDRVISVEINNSPLQPLKRYKLATSSYIARGGDGYQRFRHNVPLTYNQQMSKLLSDILINELRLTNSIFPKIESRMIDIVKQPAGQP
ncbi:bifunctional metallophosphatase/5'-nucleotidase [Psychromonas aquimarina]|uniref:bifunctional metallophosphatase/5'-nucleotidase n=1 Tax=Psychromonas aquimarina TaxID=444919 RepID=UPI0004238BC0|nr:bifunctional metallophosphatase/5'-nucleotidase [Psychromonas aquimarina]